MYPHGIHNLILIAGEESYCSPHETIADISAKYFSYWNMFDYFNSVFFGAAYRKVAQQQFNDYTYDKKNNPAKGGV